MTPLLRKKEQITSEDRYSVTQGQIMEKDRNKHAKIKNGSCIWQLSGDGIVVRLLKGHQQKNG